MDAKPLYSDWNVEDRRRAVAFLAVIDDPAFVPCTWTVPAPVEKNGKLVHSLGYPTYDPRVYELLGVAWSTKGIDPYVGEPWEPFWGRFCIDPGAFADATIGDIRRYLLLLTRRERFGDGSIDAAFKSRCIHAALARLAQLTPAPG
jgi:hypothetical protein